MIGFFEFLMQNAEFILVFVIAGALFGFVQGLGESWKYKLAGVGLGLFFWGSSCLLWSFVWTTVITSATMQRARSTKLNRPGTSSLTIAVTSRSLRMFT